MKKYHTAFLTLACFTLINLSTCKVDKPIPSNFKPVPNRIDPEHEIIKTNTVLLENEYNKKCKILEDPKDTPQKNGLY